MYPRRRVLGSSSLSNSMRWGWESSSVTLSNFPGGDCPDHFKAVYFERQLSLSERSPTEISQVKAWRTLAEHRLGVWPRKVSDERGQRTQNLLWDLPTGRQMGACLCLSHHPGGETSQQQGISHPKRRPDEGLFLSLQSGAGSFQGLPSQPQKRL